MSKCKLWLIGMLLLTCSFTFAQTIEVAGKVTAEKTREEVIGVVVMDKNNPNNGTITDLDGRFSIRVDKNAVLTVTSIGYRTKEVHVNGQTLLDIRLEEEVFDLETVVVVGVAMKKSDLTGAVGSISNEKLKQTPAIGVNEALQGRVAGVYISRDPQPGGNDTSIKIRGNNSISFGNKPIYVVDGVIMDGGFNLLNNEDIASMEILKDASATSLYGSRGANGVVVITTKRGQQGGTITYDGWVGFSSFTKKMDLMGSQGIYDLRVDAMANYYMHRQQFEPDGHINYPLNRQDYIRQITSRDSNIAFADYEHEAYHNGQSYNWLDEVTRNGFQQNHSVSFSDADEKGNYYVSFGYSQQDGLVKNSDYERYTGKVNLERSLKPWFKIGTTSTYVRGRTGLTEGNVFWNALQANPFYKPNTDDIYMQWGENIQTGTHNPINSLTIDGKRTQNRLTSANYFNINPIEGLNIRNTISIDMMDQQEYWYTPKEIGQSIQNSYDGEASHRKDHWFNWQWDASVSYDKTFAGKHKLFAMFATNMSKNNWEYNQVKGRGFASDDFSYNYLQGASSKDHSEMASDFNNRSIAAFVQRVNYTYNNKYFATVTMRQEGSSKFSKANRWGYFPSASLAWDAAAEEFIYNLNFFDQLKARVGYGIVGNENIPLYSIYSLYRPSVTNNQVVYKSDGRLGNPDLRWEKQKQLNVGIDVAILNSRLSLTADYYYIKNSDLLMSRSLSPISGYDNMIDNVGELENKGFELTVNGRVVDSKDFKWNVSGNISFNKNKITKLYGDVDAIWKKGGWTGVEIQREGNLFVGESLNSIYVYKFDRIVQEEDMAYVATLDLGDRVVQPGDILPLDINGDKIIDDNDRVIAGNTDPKFYGGFSTDFSYKNIGINAIFNYSYGGKKLSGLYESLMSGNGLTAAHTDLAGRWTPENKSTTIPRAFYAGGRYTYGDVDLGVQNSSFLRMAVLSVYYDFPSAWLKAAHIKNARIYFTGNNLLTVTKYKGFDPEGGDSYPASKMYVIGLRLSF